MKKFLKNLGFAIAMVLLATRVSGQTIEHGGSVEVVKNLTVNDTVTATTLIGDLKLASVSNAAYTSVQQMQDVYHSTGLITGGNITDLLNGSVSISAGEGYIRVLDSAIATLAAMAWSENVSLALVDNSINYIYIEYNGGTPVAVASITKRADTNTNLLIGNIYRAGTSLKINSTVSFDVGDHAVKMIKRLQATMPFAKEAGGTITEPASLKVSVSAGSWWEGLKQFSTPSVDTNAGGGFSYSYRNGAGGWTTTYNVTFINNSKYDDNSGVLADLANNQYGLHWVYLGSDGTIHIVFGTATYSLTDAQNAPRLASVPMFFGNYVRLLGNIIVKKADTSFTEIVSVFDTALQGSSGIQSLRDDTSPELGGNLSFNGYSVTGAALFDSTITVTGEGNSTQWNAKYDAGNFTDYMNKTTAEIVAGIKTFTDKLIVDARISQTGLGGSTLFGFEAGKVDNLTANSNSAFGYQSLLSTTTGAFNSAFSSESLYSNTSGYSNSAFGFQSMKNNSVGHHNTAFGISTLYSNTGGDYNSALGNAALFANVSGDFNLGIGSSSLAGNIGGDFNIAIGNYAISNATSANNTIGVGKYAGTYISDGTTSNLTVTNSIFIGDNTRALADNETNQIVIGHTTTGNGSNTVTIGNSSITDNYFSGDINATGNLDIGGTALFNGLVTVDEAVKIRNNSYTEPFFYKQRSDASQKIGFVSPAGGQLDIEFDNIKTFSFKTTGVFIAGSYKVDALGTAPATSTSTGELGTIIYTADYIYVCTATDTWKRSALTTW